MIEHARAAVAEAATDSLPVLRSDATRIDALTRQLTEGNLEAIHAFGREFGVAASDHADDILAKVRSRDLEVIGGKLSQIVGVAKTLNLNSLARGRSTIPLLGPLLDRLRGGMGEVSRRFQDVRTQIDALIGEVDVMRADLEARNLSLDTSHASVREEHAAIEMHLVAADRAIEGLNRRLGEIAEQPSGTQSQFTAQELRGALRALDKRIADMKVLQHAALQQLPMIRMVQANNRMLIEKFHTIRELTVPAWKRQFILALSLNEQKSAVQLANTIDDATNEFLLENARLLKENTISTARANQRLVIDIDTLRKVHDSLVSTMQEVATISEEGGRQRASISQALQDMRRTMTEQPTLKAATRVRPAGAMAADKPAHR